MANKTFFDLFTFQHEEYQANDYFIVYHQAIMEKDVIIRQDNDHVLALSKGEELEQVIFHLKDMRFSFIDNYVERGKPGNLFPEKEVIIAQTKLAPYLNYNHPNKRIVLSMDTLPLAIIRFLAGKKKR